jgi:hypothetical protein
MKTIRVYRHPDCRKCARYARVGHMLDWRDRLETSAAIPKTGPLRPGEIVVEDLASGDFHHGAAALDLIARQIPLYAPVRFLLRFPFFRSNIDRELSGYGGANCEIPAPTRRAEAPTNPRP